MAFEPSINTDNIADYLSDGFNLFKKTISNLFETDLFGGVDEFDALVISDPAPITSNELSALGIPGSDVDSTTIFKKFKVRILGEKTPHSILGDPCELFDNANECNTKALVAMHTTIVAPQGTMRGGIGSYVRVNIGKNEAGMYNMHLGKLVKVIHVNSSGKSALEKKDCALASKIFDLGTAFIPPPTIELTTPLRQAYEWYETLVVPNQAQHAPFLKDLNPTFAKFVKAFIWNVYDIAGGTVTINSGLRSQASQTKLYDNYQKCLATKGKTDPSMCTVAAKTLSSHGGFAIDFNVRIGTRTYGTPMISGEGDAANRMAWNASLVPSIIKEMGHGLKWGGSWTGDSYDPIHLQWRPDGYKTWSDLYANIAVTSGNFDIKATGGGTVSDWQFSAEFDANKAENKKNQDTEIAAKLDLAKYGTSSTGDPGESPSAYSFGFGQE